MNTKKLIKLFCVASTFSGFLHGHDQLLIESPSVPGASGQIQEKMPLEQVQKEQVALDSQETASQYSEQTKDIGQAELQGNPADQESTAHAGVADAPIVQEAFVNQEQVQPKVEVPSAPITRVIAPGKSLPELAPSLKVKKPLSLQASEQDSLSASTSKKQQEDVQALEDLAIRSQEVKKHVQVPPPDDSDEHIEFQFENTDLSKVIQQVGDLFNVTFISDDVINPLPQGSIATVGNKVSFRTQKSMTKKQAWNLFLNFLDIAGFNVAPAKSPRRYRIIPVSRSPLQLKAAVPSYIGVDPKTLPDNDQMIRYVYFVENGNMNVIQNVVDKLRSSSSDLIALGDAKAFILTDKAYNIKTLMVIVKELDRVSMPQSMSVMKLLRADAKDVKILFDQLMGADDNKQPMYMPPRQQPTAFYFPSTTRLIAEPRTNSLIILGSPDAIEKIEDFIRKHVDKDPETPHSPLFYYDLKFADASTVCKILQDTAGKFGSETVAGQVGGIRGNDKYVRRMTFIADPGTNRIIMKGDYQDYVMVKDLIYQIDQPQPQVAIEVLVLYVSWSKVKKLGTQLRNYMKTCGGFGSDRVQFQTSGLNGSGPIVERQKSSDSTSTTITNRLMGNLLDLVTGLEAGNTIISLGRDIYGVWGLLQLFESYSAAETVANPFVMASNKQKAVVEVGEIRRVVTATIVQNASTNTPTYDNMPATLKVEVTPQINSDGMITLDIVVSIKNFLAGSTATTVAQKTREIRTKAIVADKEVLALGGLIRNNTTQKASKTPGLGDIPVLGWLFKNENKDDERDNLLILFSTQIIDPLVPESSRRFTQHHIDDYYGTLDAMKVPAEKHDPIYRMFFEEGKESVGNRVQDFIFEKPKKRTKKDSAALEVIKKEHPVLADQPDVLDAMYGRDADNMQNKDESRSKSKVLKKSSDRDSKKSRSKQRTKVSLTDDSLERAGQAA